MEELIEKNTQGPQINVIVISRSKQHLRSHIFISTAECRAWSVDVLSGPSKIAELDVEMTI